MAALREKLIAGRTVGMFIDFQFEDMEAMYPKMRLEEEGAKVIVIGAHDKGMKYTGKYGYPLKSDATVKDVDAASLDALVIPGGFAPDYLRRNTAMLDLILAVAGAGKPVAAVCHGPWMFCSARRADGKPVIEGRKATGFVAIKDDLINAGAVWVDEPVVIDGPYITSRTPSDLVPFCHAIIDET
eukprot:3276622-Rhodomonas_salina.1